jgi:hypothetical protein
VLRQLETASTTIARCPFHRLGAPKMMASMRFVVLFLFIIVILAGPHPLAYN